MNVFTTDLNNCIPFSCMFLLSFRILICEDLQEEWISSKYCQFSNSHSLSDH